MYKWKINSKFLVFGQFILVFIIVFIVFYFYQDFHSPYFIGEDSFYHVAMAKYMMQNGLIIHQFPFLNLTILRDKFVDWHFFFHVLLIPFIKIFGEINGPKILGMSLLAGTFGVIYLILKEKKLKFASLYAIALFFLMPGNFYTRSSFIRGEVLSLFLIILSLYWFIRNRPFVLAITMFFFVWSYYLASYFIFAPIIAYMLVQVFRQEIINYKLLLWAGIGFFAGMILNPYFPDNFTTFKVFFIVSSQNDKPYIGSEIYPPGAWDWFYGSMMTVLLFFGGITISLLKNIKQDAKKLAILIFAFIILILQWKSKRFVEYWPILSGTTGLLLGGSYLESILLNIKKNWHHLESWVVVILLSIFIYEGIFHGIWEYWQYKKSFQGSTQYTEKLKEISLYLKDHSDTGDIIFARWDIFPQLFYFNDKNYYVDGNNPGWIEQYNKELYKKYIDLTLNGNSQIDPKVIKDNFGAKWVVAEQFLKEKLQKQPDLFEQVFEKEGYTIFKVL